MVGLGCGGGQKDVRCLDILRKGRVKARYTPVDVSAPLVVTAHRAASSVMSPRPVSAGLVCDLVRADDLNEVLSSLLPKARRRLITFFGMLPNFEPQVILPRLGDLLRPGDLFLVSANLAPGEDYLRGVQRVLPQYANRLTNEWLVTFLTDLGMEDQPGKVRWSIEGTREQLLRIRADFVFARRTALEYEGQRFVFGKDAPIRLFYSYRYTPSLLGSLLARFRIRIEQQWINESQEEGVFLCRKTA